MMRIKVMKERALEEEPIGSTKSNSNNSDNSSDLNNPDDLSKSYDEFKEFKGKKYTGMKIGRHHS
jgi:hypothetical protein